MFFLEHCKNVTFGILQPTFLETFCQIVTESSNNISVKLEKMADGWVNNFNFV